MYLFLGHDAVVTERDVVGVFDLDIASVQKATRDFLSRSTANGEVININSPYEIPKTMVVCERCGTKRLYISGSAAATLAKRLETE